MDIEKELQQLKQRIASLETQKNVLFGSSYSSAGSSSSDYLIKTRGKVKIQIGNKFIDLLKDGKINVDSKFIFKEKEVGSKDGIYIIGDGEDAKVIISIGGSQIDLKGEIGTTYVSLLGLQETTPEQKHTALQNIGFLYQTVSDVQSNGLKTGIVYVESEQKLYIVQDGQLTEFTIDFPNPYPKQFVISKTDKDKGALVIKGSGTENSLAFDSLLLYSSGGDTYIDSDGSVYIKVAGEQKILIGNQQVIFSDTVVSQKFQSINANESQGFQLYINNGESTLEVDNLLVRNGLDISTSSNNNHSTQWYFKNNIVSSATLEVSANETSQYFHLDLIYNNEFTAGDSLYVIAPITLYGDTVKSEIFLPFTVESEESEEINIIYVKLTAENIGQEIYDRLDWNDVCSAVKNQTIFLVGSSQGITLMRRNKNLDLLSSKSFTDEKNQSSVITRIGNLEDLKLKAKSGEKEIDVTGFGVYSGNANFLKAQYTSSYKLPQDDISTKFASTEWVSQKVNILPVGSIIMFNGLTSNIPSGWHICDGTGGTPNLIGKFIKAANTSGDTGGSSTIQILEENMPKHTHTFVGNQVTTSEAGAHTHTIRGKYGKSDNANDRNCLETGSETDLITTSQSGAHTHTIDMGNTQLSYQGEGKPIKFEPLYYSLIYIMKTS